MRQLLDFHQIEAFLNAHFRGDVCDLAPIGKGDWSQAFSFQHEDGVLVARFGEYGEDYAKDQYASQFSHPDLPIPRVLEIGQALGRHFCISERAYGSMLESLDADGMRRIVPAVYRMFDALRTADVSASSGFGGWNADGKASASSWKENLLAVDTEGDRVHGWHTAMAESPIGTAPYNEALDYLKAHIHLCPEIRHLLHTDLLHFNVLVTDDRINAVVDWGNAQYGDFLYELAGFSFYSPWYPAMEMIDWAQEARRHFETIDVDVPYFEERLRCYEAHIGLDGMAYNAFTRDWKELADTADRVLERIRRS
ncbi:MAG: phosphotransferase [Chthonomonadaceae bacterium]|nr:phosphotransferase [Chthonomonadaceae bacterium]